MDFRGIFYGLLWGFYGDFMGFSWDFMDKIMEMSCDLNGNFRGVHRRSRKSSVMTWPGSD